MTISRTGARTRSRASAFTLLEVLLVIALLAGMAAIVWPSLGSQQSRAELDNAASQLASFLSMSRSTAMSTGRRYRCVFSENGLIATIEVEDNPIEFPGVFERLKSHWARLDLAESNVVCEMVDLTGYRKIIRMKERELIEEEMPLALHEPVEFFPDGRCDSGLIVLVGSSGRRLYLRLNGFTGAVKVFEEWQVEESSK